MAKDASLAGSAHLHACLAAAEIDESAVRGLDPDYDDRAKSRMDIGAAVSYVREAIGTLVSAHGASSFAESSPLQRIWRDSETASRHAILSPAISAEVYGKSLLGIRGDVTRWSEPGAPTAVARRFAAARIRPAVLRAASAADQPPSAGFGREPRAGRTTASM